MQTKNDILRIIKLSNIKIDAKLVVFLLADFDIQNEVFKLLDRRKPIEERFLNKLIELKTKKISLSTLINEEHRIKEELVEHLEKKTHFRVLTHKLYFEYNPIYFKKILEMKGTHEILGIQDNDFLSYLNKIVVCEDKEEIVLKEFTKFLDELIKLYKDTKIRLDNVGNFQNQKDEEKQINKASNVLITYAKKTGNHKMVKYLQNIPYFWQTERDILNLYKKGSSYLLQLFSIKVSNLQNESIANKFSKELEFLIKNPN